ncbi:PREDICTED: uncharacterized protein LOC105113131 isoform X1 [Populus euphratica]|uniref:Uncharacterized protein LOC105113131 isoform X1 n=1 Tax=Populus euphratica TaxID=75702 RepID=A0AAJ6TBG3_POPEU|nr:PREDICTED: uncharacterized protein LOC105113131 isoform X1 [Populus euphratica]
MGSLMAGWDSPVPDPRSMKNSVKYRRNRSLTRGEIDAYWRSKKRIEEDHLKAISGLSSSSQDGVDEDHGIQFQRSSSLPAATTKEVFMDMETDQASLEQLIKKNGWWASSNWAFLNEPPILERASNNYTPHFHVASLATSKSNTGINA